ncbi:Variant-specific surface protein, partial [Giardia duodenalis]
VLTSGYYSAGAAPGSGVCREARNGVCVQYKEEVTDRKEGPTRVREAQTGCTAETSSADHCASGKCDVTIGGKTYCSQCAAGYVPIDGTCTQVGVNTNGKCLKAGGQPLTDDTQCGQCGAGYFLHKGGCYQFGGEVGKLICTDPSTANSPPTAGTCTTCASGYFKNPTQAANKPPCIVCNDTTGDGTSMGKAGCATCEPPESPGVAKCTACLDSFFGTGSAEDITCAPCTGDCQTCKGTATQCTSCKPETNPYWKKDTNLDTGTCVSEENCKAGSTYFPTTDKTSQKKICTPCSDAANGGIADCQTCSTSGTAVTCSACTTPTKKPNADGTKCFACSNSGTTASCDRCSADGVCEACASGKVLTPTLLCLDDCGGLPGYYADTANKRCAKCSEGCKECTGAATQCTACPAGKRLAYANSADYGTCVEECAASTGSASGSCRTCGASIGGTKYCSGCSVGAEIPVNGVCQTNPSRAAICAEPDNAGGCNKCAAGYFLLEKGCYEAAKQPGVQVCKTADGGLCTTCASGLAASGGDCSAQTCHASCRTCSAASDASKCRTCADGYYRQSSDTTDGECQRCSQGKEGCTLCKYSSGFICLSTDPFSGGSGDNTADPSVNKTGLSSGAIAGISVAVIVVVGGLVGFLCWWFVCRGKA